MLSPAGLLRRRRRGGAGCLGRHRGRRGDDGSLILTLVVVIAIGVMVSGAVATVLDGEPTAVQSSSGAEAVAQARAGLSDALFRLDQMGDNPGDFCVGDPPANLIPAGLEAASCQPSGSTPLPSAPGLQYYVVSAVSGTLPSAVIEEFDVVAHASWRGEARTIDATLYRESDTFGFFGVSSFSSHGALKQATVEAVGDGGQASQGNVDFGMGPGGRAVCSGNDSNSHIATVGEQGATVSSCPQPSQQSSSFEPAAPAVCATAQASTAFAPCVDTSSFANQSGVDYCPLPGSGLPNVLPTSSALQDAPPAASPDGTTPVFNCTTNGAAVSITTSSSLPFQLSSIPPGTYYLDSNDVTMGEIDPSYLSGPVRIFIVPEACNAATCPPPTATAICPDNTSSSLSITGNQNVASGATPPPGEPSNWSLYWDGSNLSVSNKLWFDGYLYAPGASLTSNGANGMSLFGSLVLDCWTINGSPNLDFAYPFHARQLLLDWTIASFRISA